MFAHGRESVSAQCLDILCARRRDGEAAGLFSFSFSQ
jgi:hypothetical protein